MTTEIAQTIFWYVLSATFASIAITFIWKVGLHIKFDLNEYLRERRKNRQKNMKDFHLVELEGKCFFQHKTRKYVTVCANCAEDGPASGLSELKRAKSLIRLTESILGKSIAPARNRTDEQGRKQGYWVERHDDGTVFEGTYKDGKMHGHWVLACQWQCV